MSISDKELELIRAQQEVFMPTTVRIERRQFVDDDFDDVPVCETICRLTPGLGRWGYIADRLQGITPFIMTSPYGTDVLPGDIVWDTYGRKFEVRDVKAPGSFQTARLALLDMVTDG